MVKSRFARHCEEFARWRTTKPSQRWRGGETGLPRRRLRLSADRATRNDATINAEVLYVGRREFETAIERTDANGQIPGDDLPDLSFLHGPASLAQQRLCPTHGEGGGGLSVLSGLWACDGNSAAGQEDLTATAPRLLGVRAVRQFYFVFAAFSSPRNFISSASSRSNSRPSRRSNERRGRPSDFSRESPL